VSQENVQHDTCSLCGVPFKVGETIVLVVGFGFVHPWCRKGPFV
jgi:hypothetical protein